MQKYCRSCETKKDVSEFNKHKRMKDGLTSQCRSCISVSSKRYYKKSKNKIKQRAADWREQNPERVRENTRRYYEENAESLRQKSSDYAKNNRGKINARYRQRLINDKEFAIQESMRKRIRNAMNGSSKSDTTKRLVGCEWTELMHHLEMSFKDGMSWKNYGNPNGDHSDCWHVDHIVPVSMFDLSDPDQQRISFHFTNLRAEWSKDNLIKSNRLVSDHIPWKVCEYFCLNPHT